jgi:hypothetical protein
MDDNTYIDVIEVRARRHLDMAQDARAVRAMLLAYHQQHPLDLERMAKCERDFDLVHDVAGIMRTFQDRDTLHRETFVPRFASHGRAA